MDRAGEISLLKTLLHYLDTKTTCMADAPWRNEVTAFTCPERHQREQEVLIRKRPLVMGLSCDWPKPGTYRTEDYAGVPILTVRGSDGKLRASMNGRVVAVQVAVGDHVEAGQPVVTLEAMKMEHIHAATAAGRIEALHVAVGEQVAAHRVVAEIA